jgi:hypothetical protein
VKSDRISGIWLALLCVFGFIHAALYALTNPVFESPDEPGHLEYANRFAAGRGMPNQYTEFIAEGHQQPLYYASIGMLLKFSGGPIRVSLPASGVDSPSPSFDHRVDPFGSRRDRTLFYAIRLIGCFVVGLTVLQVGRAARRLMPVGHTWMSAPLLMATWPQLAFIGSGISNDGLVALMGACVAFAAVCCLTRPESRRSWLALGVYVGLAFLTKKNAIVLAPAALVFIAAVRLYSKEAGAHLVTNSLLAIGAAVALGLPVLIRNWSLYGELLGHRMEMETMPNLVYPQSLESWHFRFIFPRVVPESLVAHFGWMVVEVKAVFLWRFIWAVAAAAALGLAALGDRRKGAFVVSCVAALALNVVGLVYYNLYFPQPQGRLLFPSLASLVLLCAMGVYEVSNRIRFRYKAWAFLPLAIALLWFDVLCFYTNQNFYLWFGERLGF